MKTVWLNWIEYLPTEQKVQGSSPCSVTNLFGRTVSPCPKASVNEVPLTDRVARDLSLRHLGETGGFSDSAQNSISSSERDRTHVACLRNCMCLPPPCPPCPAPALPCPLRPLRLPRCLPPALLLCAPPTALPPCCPAPPACVPPCPVLACVPCACCSRPTLLLLCAPVNPEIVASKKDSFCLVY